MALFESKWKSRDEDVSLKAIRAEKNAKKLERAAKEAPSYRVRIVALDRLGRYDEALMETALFEWDTAKRLNAVAGINDELLLREIVCRVGEDEVALFALKKIEGQGTLKWLHEAYKRYDATRFEICKRNGDTQGCRDIQIERLQRIPVKNIPQYIDSIGDEAVLEALFYQYIHVPNYTKLMIARFQDQTRILRIVNSSELAAYEKKNPLNYKWILMNLIEKIDDPEMLIPLSKSSNDSIKAYAAVALKSRCCPDGTPHAFGEVKSIDIDMGLRDDDDMKSHVWRTERFVVCQKCGYRKTIN